MKVILLAAGVGKRFGKATRTLPKCLVPLGENNETLLSMYFNSFRQLGLKRIVMVCGHQKEKLKKACRKMGQGLRIRFVNNPQYKKGSIVSLRCVRKELNQDCIIMDADVFFPTQALERLLYSRYPTAFLVDTRVRSSGEEMMLMSKDHRPVRISKNVDRRLKILGESIGFFKICKKDAIALRGILENSYDKQRVLAGDARRGITHKCEARASNLWGSRAAGPAKTAIPCLLHQNMEYEESYNVLMKKFKVGYESIGESFWTEMDFQEDLEKIQTFMKCYQRGRWKSGGPGLRQPQKSSCN